MSRWKEWCIKTVQRAVGALTTREENYEELPDRMTLLGAQYEPARRKHNSVTITTNSHLCDICNKPCAQCVLLRGSSVDEVNYYSTASETNKAFIQQIEASTQTESLISNLELTGILESTSCLPDLLVSSSSEALKDVPPPPPPPPPPPLPPKLLTTNISTLNVGRKKHNNLKKSQSAGLSAGPEITVELLKNVKLRKMGNFEDASHSNCSRSLKIAACTQPAVTMEVLQKVTLRKTQSSKYLNLETPIAKSEANNPQNSGSPDKTRVHNLRSTHLKRSPGGTPQFFKRKKQAAEEPPSVPSKNRRQSLVQNKLLRS